MISLSGTGELVGQAFLSLKFSNFGEFVALVNLAITVDVELWYKGKDLGLAMAT